MVDNDTASIRASVTKLVADLMTRNKINEPDIISIVFSLTSDIDALNPATALRTIGFASVPLFCAQEPTVVNSARGVIRVLLTCSTERERLEPVYANGAEHLRDDLFGGSAHDPSSGGRKT